MKGDVRGSRALTTVDGTDFRIGEPKPFKKCWWSHKYNGPALRYEVIVCIATGEIVYFNGPYPCKTTPDITIFRHRTRGMLMRADVCLGDRGYKGDLKMHTPMNCDVMNELHRKSMSVARSRHETHNRRFKEFNALQATWRHHHSKHHIVFRAIITLTQMRIHYGDLVPYDLDNLAIYDDPIVSLDCPADQ